jgi:hypothetical protein
MSSNYAVLGLAMAAAGVLTEAFGARTIWIAAGAIYLFGSLVALVMTSWLPVTSAEEQEAIDASAESAVAALGHAYGPEPVRVPLPEPAAQSTAAQNGPAPNSLDRIATLLEEIEARREREARRELETRRSARS